MRQILELDSYVKKNNEEYYGLDENEMSWEDVNRADRNMD